VLAGIVQEIPEDSFEPARVGFDHNRLVSEQQARIGQPGVGYGPDEPSEVDRFDLDLLCGGIEPRQLHQVVNKRPQAADVGDKQLAGPTAVRGQAV